MGSPKDGTVYLVVYDMGWDGQRNICAFLDKWSALDQARLLNIKDGIDLSCTSVSYIVEDVPLLSLAGVVDGKP